MTTPPQLVDYYARKGWQQRGDEPTDAYSDDEKETDTREVRRARRESVRVVKGVTEKLRGKISEDDDLRRGSIVNAGRLDNQGRATVDLINVPPSERMYNRARDMDRDHETQLVPATIHYIHPDTKLATSSPGYRVTFNTQKAFERAEDAQKFKCDALWMFMGTLALAGISFYIINVYGAYLGF